MHACVCRTLCTVHMVCTVCNIHTHLLSILSACIVQERWQLQQEWGRVHAQKSAFDQDRELSLKKAEQEREDVQKAKVSLSIQWSL